MFIPVLRRKSQIYLILLLAGFILSGCQSSQRPTQCCRLVYGLVQPGDLSGQWELVDAQAQIIQPITSRYEGFPAAEIVRQYLSSNPDERNKTGVLIHDIRRYSEFAPSLGKLNYAISTEEAGTQITLPKLPQVGLDRQIQCLSSSSSNSGNSVIVCTIEVRYQHILSMMHFYFDGLTSHNNIETLINQALTSTDGRIEEIDQHFGKSDR
jgi:hypothetical protein